MASSKVMTSSASTSRNSDHHNNNNNNNTNTNIKKKKIQNSMSVDGLLRSVYNTDTPSSDTTTTTLLNSQITTTTSSAVTATNGNGGGGVDAKASIRRTVDDVWNEIVAGNRKECKEEAPDHDDEMMTLEDFLARAGAVEDEHELKMPPPLTGSMSIGTERLSGGLFSFDSVPLSPFQAGTPVDGSGVMGFGNGVEVIGGGRGKRRAVVLEPLDKVAQQRQRRMIKNRESAARSRERKQAYQVELEALAVKLEEENEQLLKEKAHRTKERYKLLMEKVVPVVEQRRPARVLRRVRSMQW